MNADGDPAAGFLSQLSVMVFESLVSDLLNRFIGDYVENLDKSQLKIGIWGGELRGYLAATAVTHGERPDSVQKYHALKRAAFYTNANTS